MNERIEERINEPFAYEERTGLLRLSSWTGLDPRIGAGFSTRLNGTGREPYASLNCGLHVGDDASVVVRNRELLAERAGFEFGEWTCAEQVHGNAVAVVTAAEKGRGRTSMDDALPGSDAIVTDIANVMLTSMYADCVPLFFYDPDAGAVGLAHAGWKGTAGRIAMETIRALRERYGTRPERLRAAIGPSIGGCCYEVDARVTDAIRRALDAGGNQPIEGIREKSGGRAMLDLKEINRQIMIKAGILPVHIEISQLCTSCRLDWFFSHRAEGGRTGRMASWIGIREEVSSSR